MNAYYKFLVDNCNITKCAYLRCSVYILVLVLVYLLQRKEGVWHSDANPPTNGL